MSEKPSHPERPPGHKAAHHGNFKHKAAPATFQTVLNAFGLDKEEYERTKAFVLQRVNKEPAHAR